jgi:zinc transport system substrate-binding protein
MRLLLALLCLAQPALAAPKVAATIPPLAGLVAEVMQGIGTPGTLMPANAEPHSFSLRPSQISTLREADIVFAVGLELEPWLARVEGDFTAIPLAETVSEPLPARHFDLSPRTALDPHLWLDPGEMIAWELEITQTLIGQDRANTATYRANELALLKTLATSKARLESLGARMQNAGMQLITTHDAFQYLAKRLGVAEAGMLADYTEAPAGARSLSRLYALEGAICILQSPERRAPPDLLPDAPRALIDPMGAAYAGEAEFPARYYGAMLLALEGCLQGR